MGGDQTITKTRVKTKLLLALGWLGSAIVAAVIAANIQGSKPDLIVESIVFDAQKRATVTIRNQGNAPADLRLAYVDDGLYVHISWTKGTTFVEKEKRFFYSGSPNDILPAGGAVTFQTSAPDNLVDPDYLEVHADWRKITKGSTVWEFGYIEESNEINNWKKVDFPHPNLVLSPITFDASQRPSITVTNQGADQSPEVTVGVGAWWTTAEIWNPYIGLSSVAVGSPMSWPVPVLLPGASITVTGNASVPLGARFVVAFPDPDDVIEEVSGDAGLTEFRSAQIPFPDLLSSQAVFDANKKPTITVANQGTVNVGAVSSPHGYTTTWLDIDKNTIPTPAPWALPQLSAAQSTSQLWNVAPPANARYVRVTVDPNNQVFEEDEREGAVSNNAKEVRLPFPELVPYLNFNSATGKVEGHIDNEGDLGTNTFVIQYEWSNNSGGSVGTQQTWVNGGLAVGASYPILILPPSGAVGLHFTVDQTQQVAEWDEGNNVKDVPILDISAADQQFKKKIKKPKL